MAISDREVARHSTYDSCWVIVEGKVYDVTDFLENHPGGVSSILRYAGKVGPSNLKH
jgi:L-lactate dehydrogenase (cytochrome)